MRTRQQKPSGEVGRVTPCAPLLGWSNAGAHGVTRPTNCQFMGLGAGVYLFWLLLLSLSAHAQSFTNASFTIGGGGGASTGGVFSATGTIGQSDAATLTSTGQYTADNGFWGIAAVVQTPGSPPLTIAHSGTNAVISWSASFIGFVLQRNSDLNNSNGWSNAGDPVVVLNGQNTVTVPVSGYKYYRLKK